MTHSMRDKKIGIWGYGLLGKSAVNFFKPIAKQITVMDLNPSVAHAIVQQHGLDVAFMHQHDVAYFFAQHDYIIPSSGIDVQQYAQQYAHKIVYELDFFSAHWHKPIIAVTGTIGKTSTVHFLAHILGAYHEKIAIGGNIGTACFDLLVEQSSHTNAVLEVSSFQLEHCRIFAPTLAIITNLSPNHLDRHGNYNSYQNAKMRIIAHSSTRALLPLSLHTTGALPAPSIANHYFFSSARPSHDILTKISNGKPCFFIQDDTIMQHQDSITTPLVSLSSLPKITFSSNWLVIIAALQLLGKDSTQLLSIASSLAPIPHRLEHIGTLHNVHYYNDSKATTPHATFAAVRTFAGKRVILLLGGLSKGVDREPLLKQLAGHVATIYCFGAEADQLKKWCDIYGIPSMSFEDLDSAFNSSIHTAHAKDIVLLSPSGSSYDLFTDFQERGNHFKQLFAQEAKTQQQKAP